MFATRKTRVARWSASLSALLLASACSTATPTTTPGATGSTSSVELSPPASLAATPGVDPGTALLAALKRPDFRAHLRITGTERVPSSISISGPSGEPIASLPAPPDIVLNYGGEAVLDGQNYLVRFQGTDSTDNAVVWSELRVGSRVMRHEIGQPHWIELTGDAATHPRLPAVLAGLASVAPLGTTSVSGRSLERYGAPASTPLDLVTVFETTTAIKQPDVGTLELDASPDGNLARVSIHLTSDDFDYSDVMPSGMASDLRTYDYTFDFDEIGAPVRLPDPDEATKQYHAKRFGLSLDVPAVGSWTSPDPAYDELPMPESPGVIVRTGGYTVSATDAADQEQLLQNETSVSIQDFIAKVGAVPIGVERAEIGGKHAYLFALRSADGASQPFFHLEAYVVSGRHVWWVNWHAFHADDARSLVDRYRFEQVLASITLD